MDNILYSLKGITYFILSHKKQRHNISFYKK
nr:MAG TPA: hypothetical protein [Caudoviricetes sp.]